MFFSDDGSTSVEVALKIAYQYWANRGEARRRVFISFDGGYHGDTLGAMSVGRGSRLLQSVSQHDVPGGRPALPYTFEGDEAAEDRRRAR